MVTSDSRVLDLDSIGKQIPVIPSEAAGFYKQNCMICLHSNGHGNGVILAVTYAEANERFTIQWTGDITKQLERSYTDHVKATDFAACVIALLVLQELTEYVAIEQSAIGSTIDYYLVPKDKQDDVLIFNHAARLEVSGILRQNEGNTVDQRLNRKIKRLKSATGMSTFIAIVEFGQPWSKMVRV